MRVPSPESVPRFCNKETKLTAEESAAWHELRDELVLLGVLEPASSLEHVAAAFLVPKKTQSSKRKYRLIIDERPINIYDHEETKCTFQDLRTVQQDMQRGAFMSSADLEHGYYALGIHPEDRKFFTFCLEGQAWQYTCLPFGWSLSPRIFSSAMAEVTRALRQRLPRRVRIRNYLDDFLMVYWRSTQRAAQALANKIRSWMTQFGLRLNDDKSTWEVTQTITHLGLIVDTMRMELRVPSEKLQRLRATAKAVLSEVGRHRRWVLKRQVAQFAGFAQSLAPAVAPARFYLRSLYTDIGSTKEWTGKVRLSKQSVKDVRWWSTLPQRWNGRAVVGPEPTLTLTTDASKLAWGACLEGASVDGELWAHGHWGPEQQSMHISTLETLAVLHAARAFRRQLHNRACRLRVDNEVTRFITSSFSSSVTSLMDILRQLFHFADSNGTTLLPERVDTTLNKADSISRFHDLEEWVLQPWAWRQVQALFGPHTVDRFASANAHQLRRYNSRFYDPFAEHVDAFSVPLSCWAAENNYCNPPFSQLPRLVGLLEHLVDTGQRVQATVVAPRWERTPWFFNLVHLSRSIHTIPAGEHAFSSCTSGKSLPLRWDLCIFRIDC